MKNLAWHFDLHTPGYARVNTAPDTEGAARALREAGVEEIIAFAKCHFGYAYYPTRAGTPHPRMRGDAFGDFASACKDAGVSVMAYVSFGIDGQAALQRPEWAKYATPDSAPPREDAFNEVCPFTSYTDELMLPQVAELIEGYRPAGFFFDTMGTLRPCYCETCRMSFREAADLEIPVEEDDPAHADYGAWRRQRGFALLERLGAFIQERLPGAKVGFNQVGSLPYPDPLPAGVTQLTLDFPTFGSQCLHASLNAAYGATAALPSDIMPTIFNQGWGDWSLSPDTHLRQVAAAVWTRGARLFMGDRLHPANRLDPRTRHALTVLSGLRAQMETAMPPEGTPQLPDALLLHGPGAICGEDMRFFGRDPRGRLRTLEGAHRMMLDAGWNATVVAECYLEKWLSRPGLIVLPEMESVSAETAQRLHRFADAGGRVLAVGKVPRAEGRPLAWFGAEPADEPWQDHVYLPPWRDEPATLVRGEFHPPSLDGAETVRRAIAGWDARCGHRYGWGIGPAEDAPSEHAALSVSAVGRGEAWFLGVPLFTDYAAHANWQQTLWWSELLDRIGAPWRVRLDSATGGVDLVAYGDEGSTWAAMTNLRGEQLTAPPLFGKPWARTAGPVPPVEARLRIAQDGRRPKRVVCSRGEAKWTEEAGEMVVPIRLDREWDVARVDWQ